MNTVEDIKDTMDKISLTATGSNDYDEEELLRELNEMETGGSSEQQKQEVPPLKNPMAKAPSVPVSQPSLLFDDFPPAPSTEPLPRPKPPPPVQPLLAEGTAVKSKPKLKDYNLEDSLL